jgi:glycosyltransferase involved in cell wall biosynthesis
MSALLSRRPRAIIYNSHLGARQHEALGFAKEKRHIIDNGFDTDLFKPNRDARLKIRAQLGIADDVPLIGCVARLHPMKDHANFLRAAHKVIGVRPETIFVLVGRNTETTELVKVICELGLDNNVRALGERSDIPAIMAALDILVLPSAWGEAFPNVVGEAMACGIPCIATDVGDSGRIVGDTGIVVPSRDSDALAQGMLSLLRRPDRKALGDRARKRIVSEFSLGAMIRNYSDLYAAIMSH